MADKKRVVGNFAEAAFDLITNIVEHGSLPYGFAGITLGLALLHFPIPAFYVIGVLAFVIGMASTAAWIGGWIQARLTPPSPPPVHSVEPTPAPVPRRRRRTGLARRRR